MLADTYLLVHIANRGCRTVCVHIGEAEVVVLPIATFDKIKPNELWVAFGNGTSFKYVPVHHLVDSQMCSTLPVVHALHRLVIQ